MKVFFEQTIGGNTYLRNVTTTPSGDQGAKVLQIVKAGHQFWAWPTITVPEGQKVIGCDFTEAPVCATTAAEVNAQIEAITATPEEVLVFGPI